MSQAVSGESISFWQAPVQAPETLARPTPTWQNRPYSADNHSIPSTNGPLQSDHTSGPEKQDRCPPSDKIGRFQSIYEKRGLGGARRELVSPRGSRVGDNLGGVGAEWACAA